VRPTLPVAPTVPGDANGVVVPVDASKFPGGIVPTKLPPRMLVRGIKRGKR